MSHQILQKKKIESLDSNQLAKALEFNGYGECLKTICTKDINGEQFMKLTEVQISLWRLPMIQSRRLWSFIQLVQVDPCQMLLDLPVNPKNTHISFNKTNNINSKINYLKRNEDNSTHSIAATNIKNSSLTKEESNSLKTKLEGMFKKEPDESANKSFVHQQKQPKLPPKPDHLMKISNPSMKLEELEESVVEEYLEPISRDHPLENKVVNTSTFLNKYRRDSGHFEQNIQLSTNHEKIKTFRDRPLPPLPFPKVIIKPTVGITDEDEILEYTPVLESDEELPEYTHIEEEPDSAALGRPLPPIPLNNDQLFKYTTVIEETEHKTIPVPTVFRHPPPPTHHMGSEFTRKQISTYNQEISKENETQNALQTKIKQDMKLPKPPVPFLQAKQSISDELKHLNLFSKGESDEQESSDEPDSDLKEHYLTHAPCYRETDRKGARLLLTGLEDGAFIIRPSRQDEYICTLSIMYNKKMFNLGIKDNHYGMLFFGTCNGDIEQPAFFTVKDLVSFYCNNPIPLYGEQIMLKNILPPNKR
ncbi:hypothetical protein FQA39_LY09717 [Lamprigera yunnana]|nr:hypothetical protein FQA39_LY09717 [Lamprigera yunnana]